MLILALEKLGLATDVRHGTPHSGGRADADDLIVKAA